MGRKYSPETLERRREYNRRWNAQHRDYFQTWKTNNVDKVRGQQRRHREKHRDDRSAAFKAWRVEHADERREYCSRWQQAHKDQRREYMRRWYMERPARAKLYNARRRALRNKAAGTCTIGQLHARIEFYGGRCWVPGCGKPYEAIDHVIALSKGGSNWPANLRPICKSHNSRKKDKSPRQFLAAA